MRNIIALLLVVLSARTYAQKVDWFAAADFVAVKNQMEELEQDAYLREFELALYSKIDQNWAGSMSIFLSNRNIDGELT